MTQAFSPNDLVETQVTQILLPVLTTLGISHDAFFNGAFESYLLGDVLYDLGRDPITDVITREVYRTSYPAIHELFTRPGTFEFYLSVFRKIFPDDIDVQFSIPGPGRLVITISALTLAEFYLLTREIVLDAYVYYNLVTSSLNERIIGHGATGIKTQAELNGLISEISAYGVYTTVSLVTPP